MRRDTSEAGHPKPGTPRDGRVKRRSLSRGLLAVLWVVALVTAPAVARAQAQSAYSLPSDPTLDRLIEETLAARPELVAAEAVVRAQRARVPQAGAWPDPMLQVGVQNDGFSTWEVGRMETSYYSVMVSQTVPWPGKPGLRTDIAEIGVDASRQDLTRIRLSSDADVRRLYVGLLLARDRIALLDDITALWATATDVTRAVYEAGGGSQADLLRSRLELRRLKQRRLVLAAEERSLVQGLNRVRGRPLDEPIDTKNHLVDLGLPMLFDEEAAVEDALARSPELATSRLAITSAERYTDLASRGYYPDLTVNTGVMPRGGDLPPMWLVTVGGTIPVFAGSKQSRAVEEGEARAAAAGASAEAVERLIRLRIRERWTALSALIETLGIYDEGLLVESRATAASTLAQYQVGKVTFASVLEANAGVLADQDGYLQTLAQADEIVIAGYEVSLSPVSLATAGEMGTTAMPGTGAAPAMGSRGSEAASGGSTAGSDAATSGGM